MSDLIAQIQMAQRDAGERVVITHLEASGLVTKSKAEKRDDAKAADVTDEQIREVFMANGFTIKPGNDDLKPYVYKAARALLALRGDAPTAGRQMRETLNHIAQWDDFGLAPQPEKPCRCGPDGCSDSACPAKARG